MLYGNLLPMVCKSCSDWFVTCGDCDSRCHRGRPSRESKGRIFPPWHNSSRHWIRGLYCSVCETPTEIQSYHKRKSAKRNLYCLLYKCLTWTETHPRHVVRARKVRKTRHEAKKFTLKNNDYSNLQALCVECHARKSRGEAYWIRRYIAHPFCWVCRREDVPLLFAVCPACRLVRSAGVRALEEFIYDPDGD